jgi:transcription initiation factor TFIIIB Brf1 subunit/transcription initiation factor TFIIB
MCNNKNENKEKMNQGEQKTMSEYSETLKTCLSDTGVRQDLIEQAMQLYRSGQEDELVRFLKMQRCEMVEDMHKCQRKLDRIDFLIRQTKNNNHRKED